MMARPHNMWESVMLTLLNHANLTVKEIKFGGKEAFTRWRGHAAPFKAQYLGKFKAYPHHQYSFILPVDEKKGVFKWWEGLLGCSALFFFFFFFLIFSYHGKLMGIWHMLWLWQHLAIKIYSIHMNSMPEEHTVHTVSTFTWLTPIHIFLSISSCNDCDDSKGPQPNLHPQEAFGEPSELTMTFLFIYKLGFVGHHIAWHRRVPRNSFIYIYIYEMVC